MIIVGLTGGIATGKSTVASILAEAGVIVIDADDVAHDVIKKGLPAWHQIIKCFGREVLLPDGEINRAYLGDIIFRDYDKKRELNKIVHPLVAQRISEQLKRIKRENPDAIVVLDVPLLLEAGMQKGMPEVIVVYIPEQLQIKRLMARDNISEADALVRIRSQMPIEEKKKLASIVIDNSFSLAKTRERTLEVYQYLTTLKG